MRAPRRFVAVAVSVATLAGGATALQAPAARAAPAGDGPVVPPRPVAVAPARTPSPTDRTDPAWLDATISLPPAETDDVVVGSGQARAGGLPVWVGSAASGAAPAKVRVRMLAQPDVAAAGGQYLGFALTRVDGSAAPAAVAVRLDYAGIGKAAGGDFGSRLRLYRAGDCSACVARPTAATNDVAAQRLTVDLPVAPDPSASPTAAPDSGFGPQTGDPLAPSSSQFVAMSAPSGPGGDYTASTTSASDRWQLGVGSGAFTYSYPIGVPPALAGPAPSLALEYSSQAVDGRTSASNSQPGNVGEGWQLEPGYIERRFHSCTDEGGGNPDLCWSANNEYFLHFAGHAAELVRSGTSNEWRLRGVDPSWRVLSYTGGQNGDNDQEYFVVITPDGTKYWFGYGGAPNNSGHPTTGGAYTVPVYGGSGEPCYNVVAALSWCQQAYRWNVDRVRDTNDNVSSYFYQPETNAYARGGVPAQTTSYVRGGYLYRVEYGQRNGAENVPAPAVVTASVMDRCTAQASCPTPGPGTSSSYPDVPTDQICSSSCNATSQNAPTFFTTKEVTGVRTWFWNNTAYSDVTSYTMAYTFPNPGDGTDPSLWLQTITKTGVYGTSVALSPVNFGGRALQNRQNTGPGLPAMMKFRISHVDTELGAHLSPTYDQPHPCTAPPATWDVNGTDCYPQWYVPDVGTAGWVPFRKYLVTQVVVNDGTGGQPDQTTAYTYLDTPAWHYEDSLLTPSTRQSWTDYRGHAYVRVQTHPGGSDQTDTKYQVFRGMNGDRLGNGTAKSVSLTDAFGNVLTDQPYLAGLGLEERHYTLDPTIMFAWTGHRYWATVSVTGPVGFQHHDAVYVRESSLLDRLKNAVSGTWRYRQTDTTYSSIYGIPTQVSEQGDTGVTGDESCVKLDIVVNAANGGAIGTTFWILDVPYRSTTYDGSCATGTVAARTETFYDGSGTLGATPSRGNVTMTYAYTDATHKAVTQTGYDGLGRVTSVIPPNEVAAGTNNPVRTSYDLPIGYAYPYGYPYAGITTTNLLGQVTKAELAFGWGVPFRTTDANNQVTTLSSDALGRTTAVTKPGDAGASVTFAYSLNPAQWNEVLTRRLQSGSTWLDTYVYYDSLGRPIETQVAAPNDGDVTRRTSVTRYDASGHVAARTQPMAASGSLGLGPVNPALASIPNEERYTYDYAGRGTVAAQYATGAEQWRTTTNYFNWYRQVVAPVHTPVEYNVDVFGQTSSVVEHPVGQPAETTAYTYTKLGDLASITRGAVAATTTYGYDWLRRRTQSSDPDQGAWSATYSYEGQVLTSTDATNAVVANVYDVAGRKTDAYVTSTSGAHLAHWAYDSAPLGVGRLASSTSYLGTNAYTTSVTGYDGRGRVLGRSTSVPASEAGLAGTYAFGYGYDAADHVTSVAMPAAGGLAAETVATAYNHAGLLTTMSGTGSYVGATTYRNDGRLASRTVLPGTWPAVRTYSYEPAAGRLARVQTTAGGAGREDTSYSYDADGNLLSALDGMTAQAECFRYGDGLGRLTTAFTAASGCAAPDHALAPDPYDLTYAYTSLGTVGSVADGVTPGGSYTATFTVAHPHAVATAGTASYTYDANGAVATRTVGGWSGALGWDPLHRLAIASPAGTATTFAYDADGNRLVRRTGATATLYLDGMELTSGGVATRYYGSVAMRTPAGVTVLLRNRQNSATTTIDPATGVATYRRYTPYGAPRGSVAFPTERGFLDRTADPSGLDAIGARYYDPATGQFMSVDPLLAPGDPQSLSPYLYALGNPTTLSDPSGLRPVDPRDPGAGPSDASYVAPHTNVVKDNSPYAHMIAATYKLGAGFSATHSTSTTLLLGGFGADLSPAQRATAGYDFVTSEQILLLSALGTNGAAVVAAGSAAVLAGILTAGIGAELLLPEMASFTTLADDLENQAGNITSIANAAEAGAGVDATELTMTRTVEQHLGEYAKDGTVARPYGDSRLTLQEIMRAGDPVSDPGGVPGALRWDVPGAVNGSSGTWELVVDPESKTILHFLFRSG